ncbi:MAG: T9SS type A sorting domain-containing protein [Bacteroidetes bacterium]|nr:T9SS type A sorting domain-containing protein [Bacteroidota bacterium]
MDAAIKIPVFPIPLTIEFETSARRELRILDIHGRLISQDVLTGSGGELDVSSFSEGIYFLQVESSSGNWVERLVIISD